MSSRLNMGRVISNFQKRVAAVTANVHDFKMVTPTIAKVLITVNTLNADKTEIANAVARKFDGLAAPIENSFRAVQSAGFPAMVGFVKANREIKDYDEKQVASLKVLSSNLLMDSADQSLWEVKSSGADKFLVRQSNEDLSELLVTARVRQLNVPVLSSLQVASHSNREYVSFVDVNREEVRYGYVLSATDKGITVVARDDDDQDPDDLDVDHELVVESAYLSGSDNFEEVAAPNGGDKEAMKDYYKRMFEYSPEYYDQLEDIIDSHANV